MANFQKSLFRPIKRQEQVQEYLLKNMSGWEWMLTKCQSQFWFKKLSKSKRKGNSFWERLTIHFFVNSKKKNK